MIAAGLRRYGAVGLQQQQQQQQQQQPWPLMEAYKLPRTDPCPMMTIVAMKATTAMSILMCLLARRHQATVQAPCGDGWCTNDRNYSR